MEAFESFHIEVKRMAPGGIEPTTFALLARRSNQLSYGAYLYN